MCCWFGLLGNLLTVDWSTNGLVGLAGRYCVVSGPHSVNTTAAKVKNICDYLRFSWGHQSAQAKA